MQDLRPHRPHEKRLLVRVHDGGYAAVRLGAALHHPAEYAMQTARSHLEVLSSQQVLLPAGRDARLCERAGCVGYHHVRSSAENHLAPADDVAKEAWYFRHLWRWYTVSTSYLVH